MPEEMAGRGHDCSMEHPVCTGCGLTWRDLVEMDYVPICGERPVLTVVRSHDKT
jgi:hypothetical protein